MKTTKLLLINIFALGLAGCGGGGDATTPLADDPTAGGTNVSTTGDTANGGTPAEPSNDAEGTPVEPTNGEEPVEPSNVVSIGDNPGSLPNPVLAEVLSIPMADVGGYKLFGGPDSVYNLSSLYANYQFNCDGTGSFETWPTPVFAFLFPPETGTITWSVDDFRGRLSVDIVSSSDGEDALGEDVLIGEQLNDGVYVVGESSLDGRVVSHILQFDECN